MLRSVFLRAIVLLAFSGPLALAQQNEDEHASHHPEQGASEQPAQNATTAKSSEAKLQQLHQNMQKIQELMKRIHDTSEPSQKQTLLNQHLQAMRQQMALMRSLGSRMGPMGKGGMGGGSDRMAMMGGAKEGGDMEESQPAPGKGSSAKSGASMMGGMMRMHKIMDARMGMLELMLEQLLEREAVEAGVEHEH